MRGNYPPKSTKKELVILAGIFLFVILLLFYGKMLITPVAAYIFSPFYAIKEYVNTSSAALPSFVRSRIELENRIQALEQELETQKGSTVAFEYLKKENETLRNLLSATSTESILAGVIARPPRTPYDALVIDQGSTNGITEGSPVFYGMGTALGYVARTLPHQSVVTLFSSPGVETTVYVFGPDIFTTAYGEGGGVIRLSVPQGLTVSEGDMVVLPSLNAGILGMVHAVVSNPTEPEQRAYVTLEYPLQSIRFVTVARSAVSPLHDDSLFENMNTFTQLFTASVPLNTPMHFGTQTTTASSTETASTSPDI